MSEESRRLAPGDSRQLLHRILDQPNLVAAVRSLPAPALGKLIGHVGLEDAGEIVALASTAQLTGIFDDDLWRSPGPGKDETFDADRFALWLQVMLEAGEEFAACKLVELPEDLVTLAFHKQVLVINIEELAIGMSGRTADEDDLRIEKALESCLAEELDEYRIISRRHESWDTLFGLLVALDRDHHDHLRRLLARLCAMDAEFIEDNGGLFQVLTAEESLESDVAGDREDRRSEQGYIAPSSATAFLTLARTSRLDEIAQSDERDPITRAYFRGLHHADPKKVEPVAPAKAAHAASEASGTSDLLALLRHAGVLAPTQTARLLRGKETPPCEKTTDRFTAALRQLAARVPEAHAARMRELAYLANVVTAGCGLARRSMRPVEAARACVATCNLGLDRLLQGKQRSASALTAVTNTAADKLFRMGWNVLFHEVVLTAAVTAQSLLAQAIRVPDDGWGKRDLERVLADLRSAMDAGKPWIAVRSLSVLEGRLGPTAFTALAALLDQCPTLAGQLATAANEESEFIATNHQLGTVAAFLAQLRAG
jgi:hypothetical protein